MTVVALTLLGGSALSQVAPPKHESNSVHVKHSRAENYGERFDAVKCAIVQVIRGVALVPGTPYGTGFYVSADGDVVTASHVLADRVWTEKEEGGLTVDLPVPDQITIVDGSGEKIIVPKSAVEENRESWGADLAR